MGIKTLSPAVLAIAMLPNHVAAQEADIQQAPPQSEVASNVEGDIVVTAQRRAESAQRIPASITALSGEDLQKSSILSTVDLQQKTPSLVITTNASYGQPYIRGVGSDIINPGTDSSVAVFVDGVYQARATAAILDFLDVNRVEILKGPQGTLYGRNATGGAINILTTDPTYDFEGSADLLYGSYDKLRLRGTVNVPVSDVAALRVSGIYTNRDGYARDTNLDRRVDGENLWAARGKLKLEPTEAISIVLSAERVEEDSTRNLLAKPNQSANLPLPARDLAPVFGFNPPLIDPDPRIVRYNRASEIKLGQTRLVATIDAEVGDYQLRSITGYASTKNNLLLDIDATDVDWAWDTVDETSDAFSQELQIISPSGRPFEWVVGLYYFEEEAAQLFNIRLPKFGTPTQGAAIIWDSSINVEAYAAFGQASYSITEALKLTAGLRYSHEKKAADFLQTLVDPVGILSNGASLASGGVIRTPASPKDSYRAWTPRFAIEYRFDPRVMAYASATRGFKSGGFNLQNQAEQFDPEKIWSYEGGLKATWLDNRLRTNFAAFYYDYKDLQVNQYSGVNALVRNAAEARVIGFEADITAQPVEPLSLDLSVAVVDAKYRRYLSSNPNLPGAPQVDLSGNSMPRSPKYTINGGAELTFPDVGSGTLRLRGEVRYQSRTYFDQFETPNVQQDAFTLVNGRLSFESSDGRWRAAVFGRNLTDKLYRQSVIRADTLIGTLDFWGAPRTFGIELGLSL